MTTCKIKIKHGHETMEWDLDGKTAEEMIDEMVEEKKGEMMDRGIVPSIWRKSPTAAGLKYFCHSAGRDRWYWIEVIS